MKIKNGKYDIRRYPVDALIHWPMTDGYFTVKSKLPGFLEFMSNIFLHTDEQMEALKRYLNE